MIGFLIFLLYSFSDNCVMELDFLELKDGYFANFPVLVKYFVRSLLFGSIFNFCIDLTDFDFFIRIYLM